MSEAEVVNSPHESAAISTWHVPAPQARSWLAEFQAEITKPQLPSQPSQSAGQAFLEEMLSLRDDLSEVAKSLDALLLSIRGDSGETQPAAPVALVAPKPVKAFWPAAHKLLDECRDQIIRIRGLAGEAQSNF